MDLCRRASYDSLTDWYDTSSYSVGIQSTPPLFFRDSPCDVAMLTDVLDISVVYSRPSQAQFLSYLVYSYGTCGCKTYRRL